MDERKLPKKKQPLSESLQKEIPVSEGNIQKTPTRTTGKVAKRKLHGTPGQTEGESTEDRPSVTKKRRRSSSTSSMISPASLFKPALTERQQMALLLQMTDPQKQSQGTFNSSSVESSPRETPRRSKIHRRNERGETLLHLACIRGDTAGVLSLVDQGADTNVTDNAGWTPLHEASNHGHSDVVSVLIDKGANVNALGMDGDTPLHDAVINNHVQVVKLLINKGADPSIRNTYQKTPLDLCREDGIRTILYTALGIDPEDEKKDMFGDTGTPNKSSHVLLGPCTPLSRTHSLGQEFTHRAETPPPRLHAHSRNHGRRRKVNSRGSFYSDVSSSESDVEPNEYANDNPVYLKRVSSCSDMSSEENELPLLSKSRDENELPLLSKSRDENELPLLSKSRKRRLKKILGINGEQKCLDEEKREVKRRKRMEEDVNHESEKLDIIDREKDEEREEMIEEKSEEVEEKIGRDEEEVTEREKIEGGVEIEEIEGRDDTIRGEGKVDVGVKIGKDEEMIEGENSERVEQAIEGMNDNPTTNIKLINDTKDDSEDVLKDTNEVKEDVEKVTGVLMIGNEDNQTVPLITDENTHSLEEETIVSLIVSYPLSLITESRPDINPINIDSESIPVSEPVSISETVNPDISDIDNNSGINDDCLLDPAISKSDDNIFSPDPSLVTRSVSVMSGDIRRVSSIEEDDDNTCSSFPTADTPTSSLRTPVRELGELDDEDDEDSRSTVVSFSTSLPIVFGSQQQPSNLLTSLVSEIPKRHRSLSPSLISFKEGENALPTHSTPLAIQKSKPIVDNIGNVFKESIEDCEMEDTKKRALRKSTLNDCKDEQETSSVDMLSLPPKKRVLREVFKSSIINQRRNLPSDQPSLSLAPHNYDSFLTSSHSYRSFSLPQSTDPKDVYPPLKPSQYKLFTDQENDRLMLLASHLNEVDRLVVCFEQELLRAHQKSGTSYPPLNFCSVLTERLQHNQFPTSFNSIPNIRPKSQSSDENDLSQHERLLSGYVADVWDKYHRLSVMLAGRHRTEVESLWMTQIQQWKERTKEVLHHPILTSYPHMYQ